MDEYKNWLEQQIEKCLNDKDLQREHWAYCKAYEKFIESLNSKTVLHYNVKERRFKEGDILIGIMPGSGCGDKFTVIADDGIWLSLLWNEVGSISIVNNREDYVLA